MKDMYTNRRRHLDELEAFENVVEHCARVMRVDSTDAVLTIDNASQHLHHFCSTLPQRTGRPESSPVYVLGGRHGIDVSCKVMLPSSLPPDLQATEARSTWRTEVMAKKDAAFEAYKKLYEAGLVNDHLLPPVIEKPQEERAPEDQDSIKEIPIAFDPWVRTRKELGAAQQLFAHRIHISATGTKFPSLLLLLCTKLIYCNDSQLYMSSTCKAVAHINPLDGTYECEDHFLLARVTKFLFGSALSRRLPGLHSEDYGLPYYLVPDMPCDHLQSWLQIMQETLPLNALKLENGTEYLVRRPQEAIPYFYASSEAMVSGEHREVLYGTRLSRRLDYSHPPQQAEAPSQALQASNCTVSKLPTGYVKLMACIPTIMHQVELRLRDQAACTGPLKVIQYNLRHVISALTAPGANGTDSYQRLELIGDTFLKYHSTVNVFCNYPQAPESQLTFLRDQLINNARLQRSTMELEIHPYLSTKPFIGREWTLEEKPRGVTTRTVGTKTLADMVEALIGAAHIDSAASDLDGDDKVLRALQLFLPELAWQSPSQEICGLLFTDSEPLSSNERLSHVEEMICYTFHRRRLLAEALTHSTIQTNVQSYERMEWIGDAVIDIIVKEHLFNSSHEYTEGEMHTRHIGMLNKDIFAYLATRVGVDVEENTVRTNLRTREPEVSTKRRRRCLHDFVVKTSRDESGDSKAEFLDNYREVGDTIGKALREGTNYPWTEIYQLNAPKWCSDVFESVIGAVYVDSGGSLNTCREVLTKLGLMEIVERAATEKDLDFEQPMRKVRELYPPNRLKVDVKRFKTRAGEGSVAQQWACRIRVDGRVAALVKNCTCQAEAESRAAEAVLGKDVIQRPETAADDDAGRKRKRNRGEDEGEQDEMDTDED